MTQQPKQSAPQTAAKIYSTPALFKDYNKATQDLLTKNFPGANKWIVECKYKGPKDTFFINPKSSNDGKHSVDIEYIAACDGGVKVTLTPAMIREMKASAHYTIQGNKVELMLQRQKDTFRYELSHETCVALSKRASINEKISPEEVELGMGIDVAPNCQVGCGATYNIAAKDCNWNFGCRYAEKGYEVAIRTNRLRTYQTSASAPCTFTLMGNRCTVRGAIEIECGRALGERGFTATAGLEATCPVLPANTIKARVNRNRDWAFTYIARMADNWMASLSMDQNMKFGVQLTHS